MVNGNKLTVVLSVVSVVVAELNESSTGIDQLKRPTACFSYQTVTKPEKNSMFQEIILIPP